MIAPSVRHMLINAVAWATLFLEGRVVMDLWRWFVVPVGLAPIGYWQAIGLGILAAVFTRQNGLERDTDKAVTENLTLALIAWVLGWLLSFGVKP